MVKKKLPVGIDDFKEIIENNYYFVDKSMLNYFFNIEDKEKKIELFKNLAISNTDKMKYQGEHPVIYISLKDIKVNNWELCLNKLHLLLENEYSKYDLTLERKRENQESALLDLSKRPEKTSSSIREMMNQGNLFSSFNRIYSLIVSIVFF